MIFRWERRWQEEKHDIRHHTTPTIAVHFNFTHKPSNILMGGGLDDVWHNRQTNQIHIVEYKSTSTGVQSPKKEPQPLNRKSLNGIYKIGYTRQLEMYQFIARGMGFDVNDTTYFVYVDAKHYNEDRMLT